MPSQRQELLESLLGQRVQIPDLQGLFSEWPLAVNPEVEKLRSFVSSSLKSKFIQNSAQYKVLDKMDIGLFTAVFWPDASLKRACVLSLLVIWLFAWDDEMDTEIGQLADDFEAAEACRRESITKISHCFHLDDSSEQPEQSNTFHDLLAIIGDAVSDNYGIEHLGRSYADEIVLPMEVLMDPDMKVLQDQVNLILWTMNDLISLRKEIGEKAVDSLVPLLYYQTGNLDEAVSHVFYMMEKAIDRFDRAANTLLEKFAGDTTLAENLSRYIQTCRKNCTGSLYWSVRTARYGQPK
ncbi:hypothetical protein CP532_0611 [Ophiocordyceps camponoti-leonardi (nom. inval.)]|nr:hypothetical protein CP532_0611 [Ophiocordyceps camponoti-leonardi (nom. inval.)]